MKAFFAVVSLILDAATLAALGLALTHRASPNSAAGRFSRYVKSNAVRLAFIVALGATLGSLYLSEIAHFDISLCPICEYERICMFPLAVVLMVGIWRRDDLVWTYVLPPALIGVVFAAYHTQLQAFPRQHLYFCQLDSVTNVHQCTVRYVWEFGFVSIPFMSLSAFVFIIAMMVIVRANHRSAEPAGACD
ncbi:MAG: disulfide bond formation protein B [Acidimicrobiia bacterium]